VFDLPITNSFAFQGVCHGDFHTPEMKVLLDLPFVRQAGVKEYIR
jgi:hypothetical protein